MRVGLFVIQPRSIASWGASRALQYLWQSHINISHYQVIFLIADLFNASFLNAELMSLSRSC